MKPLTLAAFVFAAFANTAIGANQLKNADFRQWNNGAPVGWTVTIGAQRGRGQKSKIEKTKDGVALSGDASTREWRFLGQTFTAKPGDYFRLRFSAKATGLKREAGQRDNCYVGFFFRAKTGRPVGFRIQRVASSSWTPEEIIARVPENAASADVAIFLSKTGRLEVRASQLDALKPADSFSALVEHMDRYYSYFALKKIDWKKVAARYRKRAEAAKDAGGFVAAIKPMLAELKDTHVWITGADKRNVYPYIKRVDGNYNYRHVGRRLKDLQQIGRIAFAGRTKEGFGYIAIGALHGPAKQFDQIAKAIDGMLDAKAIIVDIRGNSGGDERIARRFASVFADRTRVYAMSAVRNGPKHTDFAEPTKRMISPRRGKTFTKPVACLIGPRCVSSGEGFAAMMKALPHVTLVGQPTRGASGNPQPVDLPNGVRVTFSRWVAMLPDKTVIEGRGIRPDVEVPQTKKGDAAFDRVGEFLKERGKVKSR